MKVLREDDQIPDLDCSAPAQLGQVPSPDLNQCLIEDNKDPNPERLQDNPEQRLDKAHLYPDKEDRGARDLQSEDQDPLGH